jgi:tetratricopeptide (TPR) repeat protein
MSNMKTKINGKPNVTFSERVFPFGIVGLIFIILSLVFSFFPGLTRVWGLNFIASFDLWVILLFYLLLLCFWIPQSQQYILGKLNRISKKSIFSFLKKHRYTVFAVISIVAGVCFYLLKIKYIFLGDTDDRATQIEKGIAREAEYFVMLCLHPVYVFLHKLFGYTGVQTVRVIDYVVGSLFIFVSLCNANLLGNTLLKKAAVFVISTLSLTILLQFCGYTEIYALPALFLQLYLFTCLAFLKNKTRIIVPALVLLVGTASHLLVVCMLPSFIFLFYKKVLWKYPFFRDKKSIVILLLISLPFLFIAAERFAFPMMLPMKNDKGLLTLFSIAHYKEFINSQFLASGIGFLLWIATLIYSLIHKLKYDDTLRFFLVASLSIVGMMFVFKMDRGSGDWDIAAFAAIVYNMANACFLITAYEKKWYKNVRYGIAMIGVFSILHTSMWIATNKTDASITWLEKAFATDPGNFYKVQFNNESMLSADFSSNELYEQALKWGKKAYSKHTGDPRVGFNYGLAFIKSGREKEGYAILEEVIQKFPAYPVAYPLLIEYHYKMDDFESLYRTLSLMEFAYSKRPESFTGRISQKELDAFFQLLADLRAQLAEQK